MRTILILLELLSTYLNKKININLRLIPVSVIVLLTLILGANPGTIRAEGSKQLVTDATNVNVGFTIFNSRDNNWRLGTFAGINERERLNFRVSDNYFNELIYIGMNVMSDHGDGHFRVMDPNGVQVYPALPAISTPVLGSDKGTSDGTAGYIHNYSQLIAGPKPLNSSGYEPIIIDPAMAGDYYIEFNYNNTGTCIEGEQLNSSKMIFVSYLDVTVVNTLPNPDVAEDGRLFSYGWPLYNDLTSVGFNHIDVDYYVYHDVDSTVMKIEWNQVKPGGWSIMFNDHGIDTAAFNAGDVEAARQSRYYSDIPSDQVFGEFKIFFADPDINIFPSATFQPNFTFVGLYTCPTGPVFRITTNTDAVLEFFLDFNNDGVYNNTDVIFTASVSGAGTHDIPWDGLDSNGNTVTLTTFNIEIELNATPVHMPLGDVEDNDNGFNMTNVRPIWASTYDVMFWDDSQVSGTSELDGCNSNCHQFTSDFGNQKFLNTWFFSNVLSQTYTAYYNRCCYSDTDCIADLSLTKEVSNNTPEVGTNVEFTITVNNSGPGDATNVSVKDQLPSGYSYVSDNSGGSYNNGNGIWIIGNLADGSSTSLQITVTVLPSGEYENYAQVWTMDQDDPDSTPGDDSVNDDDDDNVTIYTCTLIPGKNAMDGSIFFDRDLDTIFDPGDPLYINNTIVNLYEDINANGILDGSEGNTPLQSTTATNGTYSFEIDPSSGPVQSLTLTVSSGSDDAEEKTSGSSSGDVDNNNSDLEMGYNPNSNYSTKVGIRFQNVGIPQGAEIVSAVLRLDADVSSNGDSSPFVWNITGELDESASTFAHCSNECYDITLRTNTNESVTWDNEPIWYDNQQYDSPDIANIIQEIVDQSSWSSTNDLAIFVAGTLNNYNDNRDVHSYTSSNQTPPQLIVQYRVGGYPSSYITKLDIASLPSGIALTTDNIETATFTQIDESDCNNDFGIATADISVTKDDGSNCYAQGTSVSYTIAVTNNGPTNSQNVVVSDPIPAGISQMTWSGDNGSSGNGSLSNNIPLLTNGSSVIYTVDISVPVDYTGNLVNIVNVTSDTGDTLTINNSAADTNYSQPTAVASNGGSTCLGEDVYLFETSGNAVSWSWSSSGSATFSPGNLVQNPLAVGAVDGEIFTVQITDANGCLAVANTTISVDSLADLSLSKSIDNNTPYVGSNVVFTITVLNSGPCEATGVSIKDTLPSGYTYVSDNSGGSYIPATGIWTIGNLVNGNDTTLQIVATVLPTGQYDNYTQVWSSDQPDPDSNPGDGSTTDDDDDRVLGVIPSYDGEISGTVFNDLNRLTDGIVNGTGTDAKGLFANLVDPLTHLVIASVQVNTDGTYTFNTSHGVAENTTYEIILTTTVQNVGSSLTLAILPAKWISTGEHVGSGPGDDGSIDSKLTVTTTATEGVSEANFGIVEAPDVTPIITAVPNIMHGVTDFYLTVKVTELNLVNTFGKITVKIPKDNRWVLDGPYDPSLTILGTTNIDNSNWSYSSDAINHIFETNSGIAIPSGNYSTFGFNATWSAGQTIGIYTITSQIDSGSGGEERIDNNVDAEKLDYFIE